MRSVEKGEIFSSTPLVEKWLPRRADGETRAGEWFTSQSASLPRKMVKGRFCHPLQINNAPCVPWPEEPRKKNPHLCEAPGCCRFHAASLRCMVRTVIPRALATSACFAWGCSAR